VAAQGDEGKRGVAAGDEQVDGGVVKPLEYRLGPALKAVIEGGSGVEQDEGEAVNNEADDNIPVAMVHDADGNEYGGAHDAEHGAHEVGDAVESFAVVHAVLRR